MDVILLALRLGMLVILYAFFGAALLVILREYSSRSLATMPRAALGHLTVISSEDPAVRMGAQFPVQPLTLLGRSPQNTVTVPDTYASAWNSLLSWHDGQWWLEDRNSRNGTFLNQKGVSRPTVVSNGDIIGIGRTQFVLELE